MRSPVKYLTNEEYTALPVQERALIFASVQVGQREEGKNAGPFVTKILSAIGLGPGFPWCGAFTSWCLRWAGFRGGPVFGRGAVRNWAKWAKSEKKLVRVPMRGDLFYWLNPDQSGHKGFITEVLPNGHFRTIEGNTNDAGSREGDGVYRRVRPQSARMRYIRWWK